MPTPQDPNWTALQEFLSEQYKAALPDADCRVEQICTGAGNDTTAALVVFRGSKETPGYGMVRDGRSYLVGEVERLRSRDSEGIPAFFTSYSPSRFDVGNEGEALRSLTLKAANQHPRPDPAKGSVAAISSAVAEAFGIKAAALGFAGPAPEVDPQKDFRDLAALTQVAQSVTAERSFYNEHAQEVQFAVSTMAVDGRQVQSLMVAKDRGIYAEGGKYFQGKIPYEGSRMLVPEREEGVVGQEGALAAKLAGQFVAEDFRRNEIASDLRRLEMATIRPMFFGPVPCAVPTPGAQTPQELLEFAGARLAKQDPTLEVLIHDVPPPAPAPISLGKARRLTPDQWDARKQEGPRLMARLTINDVEVTNKDGDWWCGAKGPCGHLAMAMETAVAMAAANRAAAACDSGIAASGAGKPVALPAEPSQTVAEGRARSGENI